MPMRGELPIRSIEPRSGAIQIICDEFANLTKDSDAIAAGVFAIIGVTVSLCFGIAFSSSGTSMEAELLVLLPGL